MPASLAPLALPPRMAMPPLGEVRRNVALVKQLSAHFFDVSETELLAPTRKGANAALARQVAMYVCHVTLGFRFSEIGELFGRDRTTVSYACNAIEDRRDNPEFDHFVIRIEVAVLALVGRDTYTSGNELARY